MQQAQKEISETEQKIEYLRGYEKAKRQMERSELRIKEMRLNRICPPVIKRDLTEQYPIKAYRICHK